MAPAATLQPRPPCADARVPTLCTPGDPNPSPHSNPNPNPNPNPNFNQVTGLTPEAEEAQEHLMKLPARFNKLAQRQAKSLAKKPREPKEWAWLNGRVV